LFALDYRGLFQPNAGLIAINFEILVLGEYILLFKYESTALLIIVNDGKQDFVVDLLNADRVGVLGEGADASPVECGPFLVLFLLLVRVITVKCIY
jgi:hypothetical protein